MSMPRPEYQLRNVLHDGSEQSCEILAVPDLLTSTKMPRRSLIGAGIALSAVLASSEIRTANAAGNVRRSPVHAHLDQISGLLVPPKANYLISSSLDKVIKFWHLPSGEFKRAIREHEDAVLGLSLSPNGAMMASGDRKGKAYFWSLPNARSLAQVTLGEQPIMALVFAPTSDQIAMLTAKGEVIVRSAEEPNDAKKTKRLTTARQINHLLSETWNISAHMQRTLSDKKTGLTAFWLSADASTLAYADGKKTVHVCRLPGNDVINEVKRSEPVEKLAMDRTARFLASSFKSGQTIVTDLKRSVDFPAITGYIATVTCMVFSNDARILASGHSDGSIALWTVATGELFAYCFDPDASSNRGTSFTKNGIAVTYTQPCGSPIPPNATCVCNCVPGRAVGITRSNTVKIPVTPPKPQPSVPSFPLPFFPSSACSCVPVCTCIPVYR